jgi:hypothetical protein
MKKNTKTKMNSKLLIFIPIGIAIPCLLITFYGEDENADFFKKGKGVSAEYWILYNKQWYHLGEMTSQPAAIVCVSIILCLVLWIIYEAVKVKWNAKRVINRI